MGAGRRSIKLSNLSAASNPEIKEEQAPVIEAAPETVETPAEPEVFEVSGAVMKEPEEAPAIEEAAPAEEVFEVSGAVMKEPEEAPAIEEAAPAEEVFEVSGAVMKEPEEAPAVEEAPIEEPAFAAAPMEEPAPIEEPAPAEEPAEEFPQAISSIERIVENSESIEEAIRKVDHREEQLLQAEADVMREGEVSDEVGIIANGTKIHGDIVASGHLEINGVVEGSVNARGNVRVNGDVYGDIACGNLIIKEGVLKVNIQAREDIALGENARIEGDIRCRKIGVEGTIIGNITATEIVQIAPSATINGNIKATGIAMGMGAKVTGHICMD